MSAIHRGRSWLCGRPIEGVSPVSGWVRSLDPILGVKSFPQTKGRPHWCGWGWGYVFWPSDFCHNESVI